MTDALDVWSRALNVTVSLRAGEAAPTVLARCRGLIVDATATNGLVW